MFNPGWDTDLSKSVVSPMSVQYGFEASPKWHAENPGAMDAVGDFLLEQNAAPIMNWLQGQRQNARNSQLMVYNSQFRLPGIRVQYTKRFGYETLRLIAQPENAGGKLPRHFTIPLLDTVLVKPKFVGYPIPGAAGIQGNIAGGCAYWNISTYFYEFASVPGFPGTTYANDPLTKADDYLWTDILFTDPLIQIGTEGLIGGVPTDLEHDPATKNGFVPALYQQISAGSKLFTTPIKSGDMVYFEVRIDELNTSVPDTCSTAAVPILRDLSLFARSDLEYRDETMIMRLYPNKLNTWWTPAIGILPESMVAKNGSDKVIDSTLALLGMELDQKGARSIFTTRTSYITGDTYSQVWRNGSYPYVPVDPVHGGVVGAGSYNPITEPNPYVPVPPLSSLTGYIGDGNALWLYSSGVKTNFIGNVGDVVQWAPTAGVGGDFTFPGDHFYGLPGNFDVTITRILSFLQVSSGHDVFGDKLLMGFTTDPLVSDGISDNNGRYSLPPGKASGVYSPCLKGRADNMQTPVPTDDMPLDTASEFPWNGVYSGVELGEWVDGDIIRVAVDAKNGYVWFGRNKSWHYMREQVSVTGDEGDDIPGSGTRWALVLDKDPATDAYPNYYAAVSWRVGGMKAALLGGSALKYAPPKGFKALSSNPTPITIQLPA